MWNNSKSFLTTILPETPSLHMHEGTSDTASPVSQYREKHSSIFPASGKASNLAVKCSHFPWETATYIYETSTQIPCDIQFAFLSNTRYGKLISALYLFSWPWLCIKKDERTTTTKNLNWKKKNQQPHNTHHNFRHTHSLLQLNMCQRNNCTSTNHGVRTSR